MAAQRRIMIGMISTIATGLRRLQGIWVRSPISRPYNGSRRSGPARTVRGGEPASFCVVQAAAGRRRARGTAMSTLVDLRRALAPAALVVARRRRRACGPASLPSDRSANGSSPSVARATRPTPAAAIRLRAAAARCIARARASTSTRLRGTIPQYPPALAAIIDPPPVLWLRGQRAALDIPPSPSSDRAPGRRTRWRSRSGSRRDLAARGVAVVSGLARGVDSAAHRGALSGRRHDDWRARVGGRRDLST